MSNLLIILTALSSSNVGKNHSPIDYAFECSMHAVIASQSAPIPNLRRVWDKNATLWLREAYNKGGTDDDYTELPQHVISSYESLDKRDSFILAVRIYNDNNCNSMQ